MRFAHGMTFLALLAVAALPDVGRADVDLPTKFSNQGSVGNTRHNLTQRQASGGGPSGVLMDQYRNDYGEVCVYCHTPHGANGNAGLPLWNRTIKTTTYTTYDQLNTTTLTQSVGQPGANSLSCLSCHDGQTAVDSIINMPGSGRYQASQAGAQDDTFLSTWGTNPSGLGPTYHLGLNSGGCLVCHASDAGFVGASATDFTLFVIGTDLRNDHPVGIRFPMANSDFAVPGKTQGNARYFDNNSNNRMDSAEIRLYDTGDGPEVECASCHDPHGVPSAGPGSAFNPTFLRVANTASGVCLTCHVK